MPAFTTKINTNDLAIQALWKQLADPDVGLNARLTVAIADAGITLPKNFHVPFDFSDKSQNVFPCDIEPVIAGQRTFAFTYPMLTVFEVAATDQRLEKFYTFAGAVETGVNLFLSVASSGVPRDLGKWMSVFQNALLATIGDVQVGTWSSQFDRRLLFGGGLDAKRSSPILGGDGWVQSLQVRVPMQVHSR